MMSLSTVLLLVAVAVGGLLFQYIHFAWLMSWSDRQTNGLRYYGLSGLERTRFQQRIRRHALLLTPIRWLLARFGKFQFASGTFRYRNVAGPKSGSCSEESFRRAESYKPCKDDVFVVTQMRSGTTWMQHLVFQVLTRGTRDLAAEDVCLNAISPWLESHKSVSIEETPLLGTDEIAKRVIKTHLPASLCPFSKEAKYIHVVRHPLSCFASCVDFVRSNLRGFEPSTNDCLDWFLSRELMWWGTWQGHLQGWQARSANSNNILRVKFEEMKADLPAVVRDVANFLNIHDLCDAEIDTIVERCGFGYMQRNASVFEMHPPHVLQTPDGFFVSGRSLTDTPLAQDVQDRIRKACQDAWEVDDLPLARLYPDLLPASANLDAESERLEETFA